MNEYERQKAESERLFRKSQRWLVVAMVLVGISVVAQGVALVMMAMGVGT